MLTKTDENKIYTFRDMLTLIKSENEVFESEDYKVTCCYDKGSVLLSQANKRIDLNLSFNQLIKSKWTLKKGV